MKWCWVLTRMIKILAPERVFAGNNSPSVTPFVYMKIHTKTSQNLFTYIRPSICCFYTVRYVDLVMIGRRKYANLKFLFLWVADFTVHIVIIVYLETWHFQSLTSDKMWIRELLRKRKWKLKVAVAVVSDPAVCVSLAWRQVPVYMCWPNQNTWWRNNSSGATNRRLDAARGPPIEDRCFRASFQRWRELRDL